MGFFDNVKRGVRLGLGGFIGFTLGRLLWKAGKWALIAIAGLAVMRMLGPS